MSNGSGVYVLGIVVTALGSLAAFVAIEILRPGMDNALLYGQVFLFAGTIITGLFGSMKTQETRKALAETNKVVAATAVTVEVVHEKVDGLNQAALFNQEKLSLREGFDKGVAATAQVASAAMGIQNTAVSPVRIDAAPAAPVADAEGKVVLDAPVSLEVKVPNVEPKPTRGKTPKH